MTATFTDLDLKPSEARFSRALLNGLALASLLIIAALVYSGKFRSSSVAADVSTARTARKALNASAMPAQFDATTLYDPRDIKPLSTTDAMALNAAMPVAGPVGSAAQAFVLDKDSPDLRRTALQCLTSALYYEAGSESDVGQRGVAQVILNRMRHPAYPASVCGVVYQGSTRTTGCQFTFTCDGSLARVPSVSGWSRSQRIAEAALSGQVFAPVGHSTHYHADFVVPYWAASLDKTVTIGRHIFYRWSGRAGQSAAFKQRYAQVENDPSTPSMAAAEKPVLAADPIELSSGLAGETRIAADTRGVPPIEAAPILEEDRRPAPRLLADSRAGTLRLPLYRQAPNRTVAQIDSEERSCSAVQPVAPVRPMPGTRVSALVSSKSQSTCL